MNKIYEIHLKPLGPFFFGGEIVFGGALGRDKRRRSYLVHSQYLPQQTALLGMLRESLLRAHGELITASSSEKEKREAQGTVAAKRVGAKGFTIPDTGNGFGCIKALSPLVLKEGQVIWQPQPMDDLKGKNDDSMEWRVTERSIEREQKKVTSYDWWLKNFDAKAGLVYQFSNGAQRKELDELFYDHTQVGVRVTNRKYWRKNEDDGKDDEEGFYRQTFRTATSSAYTTARYKEGGKKTKAPPPDISFVFRVEINSGECPEIEKMNDTTVQLGGERSSFKLTLKDVGENASLDGLLRDVKYLEQVDFPEEGFQRIVLLSDAYVDLNEIKKRKGFVVGYPQPFRYFSSNLNKTKNFQFLRFAKDLREKGDEGKGFKPDSGYDPEGRWQSRKHTLLLRGSIIIAPASAPEKYYGADQIIQYIEDRKAFRRIGYNYCKITQ